MIYNNCYQPWCLTRRATRSFSEQGASKNKGTFQPQQINKRSHVEKMLELFHLGIPKTTF